MLSGCFTFAVHVGTHVAVNSSFGGCYSCLHERRCDFLLQNSARLCVQLLSDGVTWWLSNSYIEPLLRAAAFGFVS
jgi:hypothetical protein